MHKQHHRSSEDEVPCELRNLGRLCGRVTFELEALGRILRAGCLSRGDGCKAGGLVEESGGENA